MPVFAKYIANFIMLGLIGTVAGFWGCTPDDDAYQEVLFQKGTYYFQEGDYLNAARTLHQVLDIAPDDLASKKYLAGSYSRLGLQLGKEQQFFQAACAHKYSGILLDGQPYQEQAQKNLKITTAKLAPQEQQRLERISLAQIRTMLLGKETSGMGELMIIALVVITGILVITLLLFREKIFPERHTSTRNRRRSAREHSTGQEITTIASLAQEDLERIVHRVERELKAQFFTQEEASQLREQFEKLQQELTAMKTQFYRKEDADEIVEEYDEYFDKTERFYDMQRPSYQSDNIFPGKESDDELRPPKTSFHPLTEASLFEWWNRYGAKDYSICAKSLRQTFDPNIDILLQADTQTGDGWNIIGVRSGQTSPYYAFPRRNGLYNDALRRSFDSINEAARITTIKSLKKLAKIDATGKTILEKGVVELREK